MAVTTYQYVFPERFVAGTVGDADERLYFVQAREGNRMTNVLCELKQVEALAEHLGEVLEHLSSQSQWHDIIPPARDSADDLGPLDVPLDVDFRAGTMTITWVVREQALQIELYSRGDYQRSFGFRNTSDSEMSGQRLQVLITPERAREFTARVFQLTRTFRPVCPFCAQGIEPSGHICPRANGYRKPLFETALGRSRHLG